MNTYNPGADMDAMFDVTDAGTTQEKAPKRAVKSVAFAACPDCTQDDVGLAMSGTHLYYREHHRVTHGGVRLQCRASHSTICDNPPQRVRPAGQAAGPTHCKHPRGTSA